MSASGRSRGRIGRRIDKLLLTVFGPADLGDRSTSAPVAADVNCTICGRPMSQHTFVRAAQNRRRVVCPAPAPAKAQPRQT